MRERPTAPVAPARKMCMPLRRDGVEGCDSRPTLRAAARSRSPTGCSAPSPRPRTSCRRRCCACTRPTGVENERGVHDHRHDAAGDRRAALGARAARDLHGRVAARAAGRGRGPPPGRGRGGDLARLARAARAPDARTSAPCSSCATPSTTRFAEIARGASASPRTTAARSSAAPAAASARSARASTPIPSSATRSPRASSPPRARATWTGSSPCSRPDAVLIGDGGGRARALPRPMVGAAAIARAFVGLLRPDRRSWGVTLEPALGQRPAGLPRDRARRPARQRRLRSTSSTARISAIHSMLNPDKLGHLGPLSDVALRPAVR